LHEQLNAVLLSPDGVRNRIDMRKSGRMLYVPVLRRAGMILVLEESSKKKMGKAGQYRPAPQMLEARSRARMPD